MAARRRRRSERERAPSFFFFPSFFWVGDGDLIDPGIKYLLKSSRERKKKEEGGENRSPDRLRRKIRGN